MILRICSIMFLQYKSATQLQPNSSNVARYIISFMIFYVPDPSFVGMTDPTVYTKGVETFTSNPNPQTSNMFPYIRLFKKIHNDARKKKFKSFIRFTDN